jgi:hypothetical protein
MVGQTHRFNCKSGGDILILYADQVVAVIFFAAEGEVRGTAPNASCGAIEIRDHEFVMDSVAGQRGLSLEGLVEVRVWPAWRRSTGRFCGRVYKGKCHRSNCP